MATIEIDLNKPGGAQRIADILAGRVERGMKTAAAETARQLDISTPVRTGRARYSWFCTVNAPSDELPPEGYYNRPDVNARVNAMGNFTVSDTIFITNNVPYVPDLNRGTSRQAPARFVERSAARAALATVEALKKGRG